MFNGELTLPILAGILIAIAFAQIIFACLRDLIVFVVPEKNPKNIAMGLLIGFAAIYAGLIISEPLQIIGFPLLLIGSIPIIVFTLWPLQVFIAVFSPITYIIVKEFWHLTPHGAWKATVFSIIATEVSIWGVIVIALIYESHGKLRLHL